ncbi:hypothetical protein GCM10010247_10450 [Streptomyces calvus]|nr:hypothetical protein GCM10010247_10450 [Streptomyces calvus]
MVTVDTMRTERTVGTTHCEHRGHHARLEAEAPGDDARTAAPRVPALPGTAGPGTVRTRSHPPYRRSPGQPGPGTVGTRSHTVARPPA